MKFDEFNFEDDLLKAISFMGFEKATQIQEEAIPRIMANKDLIACAQTGTGKTAAFLLPVLNKIIHHPETHVNTLIIVPTRELALQIDQQIQGFSYFLPIDSIAIYGGGKGDDWGLQKRALSKGVSIVVATPGKLIAHLNMGYVNFKHVQHLILDEADRMLDIGFHEDLIKIISFLPKKRQNLMFSATMAPKIKNLASKILHNPEFISLQIAKPAEGVLQAAYLTFDNQKTSLLDDLIAKKESYKSILVFCSTKKKVAEITRVLQRKKYDVGSISSDLDQQEREKVLQKFRAKRIRILVATDVLSRGIDIKDINLVINYDVPSEAADYVHRIGRTARADTTGVAITFINEDDMYKFKRIEELIEKEVIKSPLPKHLGEGPAWSSKKTFHKGKGHSKKGGKSRHSGNRSGGRQKKKWSSRGNSSNKGNRGRSQNSSK